MVANSILVDTDSGAGGNLTQLEQDLTTAVQARTTAVKAAKPQQKQTNDDASQGDDAGDLPTKLRGKTPQQIAEMYTNLESAYGRMANDLGTQRKLTDRLLDLKRDTDLQNNTPSRKVEIKSDELLENPTAALERFSQARDAENQQRMDRLETSIAAQAFHAQHPDFHTFANDQDFFNWVQSSPIRLRAAAAAQQGAWDVAGDLLSEYKASKARTAVNKDDDDEGNDTEAAARAAAAAASLESSTQGSAGAKKGGKTYRRTDLMRLRAEKPDVYYGEEFQAEILRAYAENRVK
jgi:hypothetical protein